MNIMADYPGSDKSGEDEQYVIDVDKVTKNEWSDLLPYFDDSSIYQTWSYGTVHWGRDNLSYLVLKKAGKAVAMAQARIISLPWLGACVTYIPYGPLWRYRGKKADYRIFRHMLRALYHEYVCKRRTVLILAPNEFENMDDTLQQILGDEGYGRHIIASSHKTILNDITPSLEDLRKGLHKRWREKLSRAMRNDLEIREGTDEKLYETFVTLYKEMRIRKQFSTGVDIHEFKKIQSDLPRHLKMKIMICTFKGRLLAGLVWSAIGDTGLAVFSATGNDGLKSYGAYLLRWRMVEKLKESGCRLLDQGGVDMRFNPGGYHFKAGMGGLETSHIGRFGAYNSKTMYYLISSVEKLRSYARRIKGKPKEPARVC